MQALFFFLRVEEVFGFKVKLLVTWRHSGFGSIAWKEALRLILRELETVNRCKRGDAHFYVLESRPSPSFCAFVARRATARKVAWPLLSQASLHDMGICYIVAEANAI